MTATRRGAGRPAGISSGRIGPFTVRPDAIGTVLMGVVVFGESLDAVRIGCIALVMIGIVGLKLQAAQAPVSAPRSLALGLGRGGQHSDERPLRVDRQVDLDRDRAVRP